MSSEPDSLAYMATNVDKSNSFDLPRWQTHQPNIDHQSSSAHTAHPAQAPYQYPQHSGPPPQSLTAGRPPPLQASASQSRQARLPGTNLLETDQPPHHTQFLSPTQQTQLSRSASLSTSSGSRARRHHQPEDLEIPMHADNSAAARQRSQGGNYYPSSGGYLPQQLTGQSNHSMGQPSSSPAGDKPYSDMYYGPNNGPPPKRSQGSLDAGHAQQSPFSPPNAYSYTPSSEQQQRSNSYHSHSRSHSATTKQEAMTPPISSPYQPETPLHFAGTYQPSYSMETSTSHTPSQPHHLNLSSRHTPASTPGSPMSYVHTTHSHPGQYYSPDHHAMAVDPPSLKRRASGFRQVRDSRDLQPRMDIPKTNRRMDATGLYLSPLRQLTTHILETYRTCNTNFRYESTHNPRRVLTKPSKPAHNEGYDNDDYDYILYVNDWLGTEEGHKYLILDVLGQGTFGQVVKCQNMKTHEIVAVKVVKNKPAYFNQSMMEVTILEMLNKNCDPTDEHHILRLRDSFIHRNHLCLVFELLSSNLYELIKQNQFQGLSTQLVKVFMAQLLDALTVLKEARLIHCDLKPENILLKSLQSPTIKVIDFGSACHERQTVYTYIQSRFYRSPEVLLGLSYNASIDMWSLGCIAVELFLGLPLFPGTSEYNQLTRIVEMLGMPPLSMLNSGKQTAQFFDSVEIWNARVNQTEKQYRLKSIEQYSREHNTNEQPGKQYFKATTLPDIINTAPMPAFKSSRHGQEMEKELNNRMSFIDFCQGLLNLNPLTRWTPQQARMHPFITGEKFVKPFVPDGAVPPPAPAVTHTDPKRPYGGLVPSQPKGTRAYQDAATYNQHLAQHQVYTAQAASQANTSYRNPYMNPQNSQSQSSQASPPTSQNPVQQQAQQQQPQQQSQHPSPYETGNYHAHPQPPPLHPPQQQQQSQQAAYSSPQSGHRGLNHQNSTGNLNSYTQQYSGSGTGGAHLSPNMPSNSYYPNSRNRANTINQMDAVPPALARLQHMNQDIIGRNALTPVMNRDDAIREWERRQSGKPSASQPYPQLEFLQQQAEMAAAQGLANWSQAGPGAQNRYQAPPSKLSQAYHPQTGPPPPTIMVDDKRRDAVMSNVRSAARGDGMSSGPGPTMYSSSSSGVISSPPQAYSSNSTTTGNRYASTYPQQPQQQSQQQQQQQPQSQQQQMNASSPLDSIDRRGDMSNVYIPMQPERYGYGSGAGGPNASSSNRHVAAPPSAVAPAFYGANVVPSGATGPAQQQQQGPGQQSQQQGQRNPFNVGDVVPTGVPPMPMPNVRRNSGMDAWPTR